MTVPRMSSWINALQHDCLTAFLGISLPGIV
jgi:hypothetical protein